MARRADSRYVRSAAIITRLCSRERPARAEAIPATLVSFFWFSGLSGRYRGSQHFPHQQGHAESGLGCSDRLETALNVKTLGMGIADDMQGRRSLYAGELRAVFDQ